MNKKHVFFAISGLFIALLAAIIIINWNKHLIYLSSGEVIKADRVWVVLEDVYYEKGYGTLERLKLNQVDQIISANFSSVYDWETFLAHEISSLHSVFDLSSIRMIFWGILLLGFGLYVAVSVHRYFHNHTLFKDPKKDDQKGVRAIHISSQLSDFNKILLYFLNLFLLQTNTGKKDKYEYRQLEFKGPLDTSVYEFRIKKGQQKLTRRISMGRIGEESSARSKCFYVIYDDHIVVKIPPDPIADFDKYIKNINADRRIAAIIAPRECLVARLGIVLNRIPGFADAFRQFQGDEEDKYVAILKASPKFQEFLKIGGSFAFFMDLSKFFFLGQVLKDCHDHSGLIEKELENHLELIWNPDTFVNRYGEDAADLCFKLQNMFNRFDDQLISLSVPEFQKKTWFKYIFTANAPNGETPKIPPQAVDHMVRIRDQHAEALAAYRQILKETAHEQTFRQNIPRIQSICSQILELLAWLFFKDVAIRDLKPDNMLVVGDPERFPQFLNAADGFELGLIDVEIAAFVGSGKTIDQPKIGWTPFYATPTHMFLNSVLEGLYDDAANILKLQDWFAVSAICYEVVTGEKLFRKTGAIISSLGRELPAFFDNPSKMKQFAKIAGAKFWPNAAKEFEFKITANKSILSTVKVDLLKNAKKMFSDSGVGAKNNDIRNILALKNSKITAYDLIRLMFEHVKESMFEEKWLALVSNSHAGFNKNNAP